MCPGGLPLSGSALFASAIDWQLTQPHYSFNGQRTNQGAARRHIDSHG